MNVNLDKDKRISRAPKIANLIFVFIILYFFLITIYGIYKIYNIPEYFSPKFYYSTTLLSLLFAILFIFGLRFLRNDLKIKISMLIFFTSIPIFACEIYLDIRSKNFLAESGKRYENMRKLTALKSGLPYDVRSKIEVIKDLNEDGIEAYPSFSPHVLLTDSSYKDGLNSNSGKIFPLGGISNKIIVQGNESGFWVIYKTDKFGFHNPENIYSNKKIDIVVTGDSFVEGFGVKSEENISSLLGESGFKVVNLGKSSNGPLIKFAQLKEYIEPLKPKVVLWFYYVEALNNLNTEMSSSILNKYLEEEEFSQKLRSRQNEIDEVLKTYINLRWEKNLKEVLEEDDRFKEDKTNWLVKFFRLSLLRNIRSLLNLEPAGATLFDREIKVYKKILNKSNNIVSKWGGKMYVVYLPRYFTKYAFNKKHEYRENVLEIFEEINIPVIDTFTEVFEPHPDVESLFPFRIYGHYNAEGYRLISKTIIERLSKDGFQASNLSN